MPAVVSSSVSFFGKSLYKVAKNKQQYILMLVATLILSVASVGCSRNSSDQAALQRKKVEASRTSLNRFASAFQRNFVSLYISVNGTGRFADCYEPAGGHSYQVTLSMEDTFKPKSFRNDLIQRIISYLDDSEWGVGEVWSPGSLSDGNAWEISASKDKDKFELKNAEKASVANINITGPCLRVPAGSNDLLSGVDSFRGPRISGSPVPSHSH
ncbi:hypothetical protein [Actinoallomurus acaciae]|uniref:Lipoprotein n=1 Tax=Actinoallomurus acaciae TaxID=502577 RepID=A0ABV5YM35_9ACTN